MVQAQHTGRHPWDAANLLGTLDLETMNQVFARQANTLPRGARPVVRMRFEDVNCHHPAIRIDLHTHDDGIARRVLYAVVRRVDAIHIDELQREVEFVARIGAAHHAHQKLAVARKSADQRFAHVAQGLTTGNVAHRLPTKKGGLNRVIRQLVRRARCALDAGLHDKAGRPHHVGFDHAAKLARIVVVVAEVAPRARSRSRSPRSSSLMLAYVPIHSAESRSMRAA
nr:hypothetical protein [Variovorax boronicumulans]